MKPQPKKEEENEFESGSDTETESEEDEDTVSKFYGILGLNYWCLTYLNFIGFN